MSTAKKIIFSAIITIGFFSALELGLRFINFQYQRNLSYLQFGYPSSVELHQVFELDAKLLFRLKPGYDFGQGFEPLNQQGFRGKDFFPQKPPGIIRVACLGDSVTFGTPEGAYPELLENILRRKFGSGKFEVYNFGVPGYTSFQGGRLLKEVLEKYHPDIVIISYVWNDHWLARGFSDSEQKIPAQEGRLIQLRNLLAHLRLYQFLNWLSAKINSKLLAQREKFRVPINEYEKNLKAMIQLARAYHSQVILATAPAGFGLAPLPDYLEYLGFIKKGKNLKALHHSYNQMVRKVTGAEKIPLVDLDLIFQSRGVKNFFPNPKKDIIHPNLQGMKLIAQSLAEKIAQLNLKREGKNDQN